LVVQLALEMMAWPVGVVVHAIDEHGGVVLGRSREDHFLRAGGQVLFAAGLVQEDAGGFDHDVGADLVPLQVGGVLLLRQADLLAVDDQGVAFDADGALEAAVHAVVLQHVGQIVGLQQVVDATTSMSAKFWIALRSTLRPMRPKPLMPILMVMSFLQS
jgi:hypothetical protein